MKYGLDFVCVNADRTDSVHLAYDVKFSYDPNQYGNGTYMSCLSHNRKESGDRYYDIRYERSYSKDRQMQFILDWVLNTWSGERGSYRATEVSIKEIADEV